MGIVAQLADRVAVMYSGSVVEASDVDSLFGEARHPYARALLEAVPRIDGNQTSLRAIPGGMPPITNPPSGCRFHLRCPRVFEPCAGTSPTAVSLGERHSVACHLYGERPT
jgi:oligopeptide/dipeptide ABC transporter ATP-binding protein